MTIEEARAILTGKPKFGDEVFLAAMQRVKQEDRCESLRKQLVGREVVCEACSGTADNCHLCRPDGMIILTKEWVALMDITAVESWAEELGLL